MTAFDRVGLYPRPRGSEAYPAAPPEPEKVELCREFIRACCAPRKTWDTRHNSYGYKHRVEEWLRDQGRAAYIPNGAFIAAAIAEGYEPRRDGPGSPNAVFRMQLLKKRSGGVPI